MAPPITCNCGTCHKCKRRIYMRAWYAKNAEQHRKTAKASRQRRLDAVQEYDRKRGFRIYDPAKLRARKAVARAISRGDLWPEPCELCGEHAEAHHDDYTKPLEVRWLCRSHHGVVHRKF